MLEIIKYFLHLGSFGFGGPMAIVVQMQKDLVQDRKWIDEEEFQHTFAIIKTLPGPIAFQVGVYLGKRRAGFWGAFAAGLCLILPSFFLILVISALFPSLEKMASVKFILNGMSLAALAVMFYSIKSISGPHITKSDFWVIVIAGAYVFYKELLPEPIMIVGFGVLWALIGSYASKAKTLAIFLWPESVDQLVDYLGVAFKAGALTFGSGLAIVPILEADIVEKYKWISHAEFMQALTFGQITPGPVMIAIPYIAYKFSGVGGAALSLFVAFAPSFIHITTWFVPALNWMSRQKWIYDFSKGAIGAIVGTLLIVLLRMTQNTVLNWHELVFLLVCLGLTFKSKLPSWLLILLAGPIYLALVAIAP